MASAHLVRWAIVLPLSFVLFCNGAGAQQGPITSAPLVQPSFSATVKLAETGQTERALLAIETALKTRPQDPQWRFLKGTVLAQSGRASDAVAVFTALTEDFPNLPEPLNNLAVLQAANGQTGQARVSLEAAIRADPAYAVAHENLGDVHAQLALESYRNALAAKGDSAALSKKMKALQLALDFPTSSSSLGKAAP